MVFKRIIPLTVVALLLISFAVVPALALLPVGQQALNFQLTDLSNNVRTLSSYRGKVVVIDFFTPSCSACQQDAKNNLIPLYNTYYKNNANVQFLSICADGSDIATIHSVYLAATGTIPWPILTNGANVNTTYGIQVYPTVYVIDTEGIIAAVMSYPIDPTKLKSAIDNAGSSKTTTTTTITASNNYPAVGQAVTFTVTLKAGTTLLSKPVHLWCTFNGVRYERGTVTTVNGVYTFTGPFSAKGQVIYHADFAGDGTYAASSGTVTVNVS